MGVSVRPQIKFTNPIQCEEYFIGVYHLFIKGLFFKEDLILKKNIIYMFIL